MQRRSILISHWGGRKGFTRAASDCVDPEKDIVVPPITPIQHDLPKFERVLAPGRSYPGFSGLLTRFYDCAPPDNMSCGLSPCSSKNPKLAAEDRPR